MEHQGRPGWVPMTFLSPRRGPLPASMLPEGHTLRPGPAGPLRGVPECGRPRNVGEVIPHPLPLARPSS